MQEPFVRRSLFVDIEFTKEETDENGKLVVKERESPVRLRDGKAPITASIQRTSSSHGELADITIYGLNKDEIKNITVLSWLHKFAAVNRNIIHLSTPDGVNVYSGIIASAYADFNSMPEVPVVIQAKSGIYTLLKLLKPRSYADTTLVRALADICGDAGITLDMRVEDQPIRNISLNGTFENMLMSLLSHFNYAPCMRGDNVLLIVPKGEYDSKHIDHELSAQTGLIGYPIIGDKCAIARVVYSSRLRLRDSVKLVTPDFFLNGHKFVIAKKTDRLGCNMPNATWESELELAFKTRETDNV